MSRIRLYFDEDAMQHALVVALRARHVDVVIASDCGMVNRSDEAHLRRSSSEGRVLYSFNVRDCSSLHVQWVAQGEVHSGIILAFQQRYSIGEQQRRLLYLLSKKTAEEMGSRL